MDAARLAAMACASPSAQQDVDVERSVAPERDAPALGDAAWDDLLSAVPARSAALCKQDAAPFAAQSSAVLASADEEARPVASAQKLVEVQEYSCSPEPAAQAQTPEAAETPESCSAERAVVYLPLAQRVAAVLLEGSPSAVVQRSPAAQKRKRAVSRPERRVQPFSWAKAE